MGSNLLKFANIVVHLCGRRHQWPDARYPFLPDVKESRSVRGQEPFVQAGSVIITVEIVSLIREMGEGVRAVHNGLDPPAASHLADFLHRENLSRKKSDVREMNHLGTRGHGLFEYFIKVIPISERNVKGNSFEDDSVSPLPLEPGSQHARVILIGGQNLVATFQIQPQLADFERFTGVARNSHFLRITTEIGG